LLTYSHNHVLELDTLNLAVKMILQFGKLKKTKVWIHADRCQESKIYSDFKAKIFSQGRNRKQEHLRLLFFE